MGRKPNHSIIASMFIFLLLMQVFTIVDARSVHSVEQVELLPQGDLEDSNEWQTDSGVTFLSDSAKYTESMIADNRMTIVHQRPDNFQTISIWSQQTSTESNNSIGSPDLQYSYTSGPVIKLSNFDTSVHNSYEIVSVSAVIAFRIPGTLQQDQVQFIMNYDGNYENLATYLNTQNSIDYMSGNYWTKNVTSLTQWNWQMIEDLEFTLDYVSAGSTDDSRLEVDAVGIDIVVKYPWYGSEWASVSSTFSGHIMPVDNVNLSVGQYENMALSQCGLTSSLANTVGTWTSEILQAPPNQTIGRVHYYLDDSSLDDTSMQFSISNDGINFGSYFNASNHELVDEKYLIIKFSSNESCISGIKIDYNDPSLILNGRVFGNLDGLSTINSKWKAFINDQEITYQPLAQIGSFNLEIPVGQYMEVEDESIEVKIQAWFNWDSSGSASTSAFEISSLSISGGFDVEWDEDPNCQLIGAQNFDEDGGGILIPFINGCEDDRTDANNLTVDFNVADDSLISVDLSQGDIRILLNPEQSGVTTVQTIVSDGAGNTWQETFAVNINPVDDAPILNEFPAVVPVELSVSTQIPFSYSDIDSESLTAYTNRSWATIDLDSGIITVTAPNTGSIIPVEVNICDQNTCVQRILDLEVMSLPDLVIEDVSLPDGEIYQRDIIPVRVYVRNNGASEASSISVRCQEGLDLVGIQTIPLLMPGQLGVVTCDWLVPESTQQVSFNVEIDRGGEISEGDESNNFASLNIDILEPKSSDKTSSSSTLSSSTVWIITIIALVILIGLFTILTPPKIKKIN